MAQRLLLFFAIACFSLIHASHQLDLSQSQALRRAITLLNHYPQAHTALADAAPLDFCAAEPSQALTVVCYDGNVTQLHVTGSGSLPPDFSTHSLFASLARLPTLKVLTLASLAMWGPLPGSVGRLSSLEILNVSSNRLAGEIPVQLLHLRNLHTLILDRNGFAGKVPFWLGVLPSLTVLSLADNSLGGSLPNSLGKLMNLRALILSGNNLSGQVPNLKRLTNLQVLDLKDNELGPRFPALPRKLVSLVLRNNRFRFGVPEELSSLYLLQKLDVSLNALAGPFPPALLSLPSLAYLDVSGNKLTGALSRDAPCGADLVFVNLSSNYLAGKLPSCLATSIVVRYSGNCLSSRRGDREKQNPPEFCHKEALAVEVLPRGGRENKHGVPSPDGRQPVVLASGLAGGIVGCALLVGLVSVLVKKAYVKESSWKKPPPARLITETVSNVNTAKLLSDAKYISETMKMGASLPAYRTFSLEELKEATNNFDASTLISENSNGQIYRGKLSDGTLIGIRSLKMQKKRTPPAYTHHLELISKLRHCHLVSALGHCLECHLDDMGVTRIFLVFEFAPNGTLRECVSVPQGQNINWAQRISAAIGVTKGIQFLHTGIVPGVYSNNLKITNVLMDHNMRVKIGSYNLPLLAENVGTVLYSSIPKGGSQERANHEDKNDVFDIGVILLEIILGRPVLFHNEVGSLKDLVRVSLTTDETGRRSIVDPAVHKQCSDESLKTMMEICVRCLSNEPADRPSVEDILWTLQFAAQVQESGRGDSMNSVDSLVPLS